MRIMMAGGSGLIGRELASLLVASGDEVLILSRNPTKVPAMVGIGAIPWDGKTVQEWAREVDNCEVIINLTGENLSGKGFPPTRWTEKRKQLLVQSRVESGKVLTKAIELARRKPSVFVQASGIDYYASESPKVITEEDPAGNDFLARLSVEWEASSKPVEAMGVRRIVTRNGIVLSKRGGALPLLMLPYKLWVGGRMGSGKQVYSWIHIKDEIEAIRYLIMHNDAQGVYNLTSPSPLSNDEFGRTLGKVLKRPHYFPVPATAMKLALGEVASMVLEGDRVVPKRLLELGYQFKFPFLADALADLLGN
ncbi:MAG: TIGR01777 family protein [Anaerolineales bacterium]|nr:MAG: TIGR01777 family protein [Anaerolineales bacterium]